MRTLTLVCLVVSTAAAAEPPSAEQVAKLQHEVEKAQSAVDKKYEGRELSQEERKRQMQERAAAENEVLDKAGVDRKDYARAEAKLSKDDRATVAAEREKLEKKDKVGSEKASAGGKEVVIEKGGKGQLSPEEEAAAMDRAQGYGKGSSGKRRK